MNNGEFYVSSETNKTTEYRHFPAEIYSRKKEENFLGKEQGNLGNEITTLLPKEKKKANNGDGSQKSVIDKIFNSIKAVTTTATVAVFAAVVTTTFVINAPKADLKSIDVGHNYVEYQMEISDLDENGDYSIVVSTSNEDDIEFEVEKNGEYKNRVEGLKPQWEYTLSLVCHDTSLGDVTHFEVKFQTLKYEEQQPNPPPEPKPTPPDTYDGAYTLPTADEIAVNWSEMTATVPIRFENIDDKYYYKLIATDQNGEIIHTESEKNDKSIVIPITDTATEYNFTFEIYGVEEAEKALISTHSIEKLELLKPSVNITDISIVGKNVIRVYFDAKNAQSIDIFITYAGSSEIEITTTSQDILRGYTDIEVSDDAVNIDVTPKINLDGYTLSGDTVSHTFESNLDAQIIVDLYTQTAVFLVKYIGNGSDRVCIISSLDPENPLEEYLNNDKITVGYNEYAPITYTLYLTNENGDILSNQVEFTVDTSTTVNEEYNLDYVNPGDVAITYNDDGTINAIIPVVFEAENPDVYYNVVLNGNAYKSYESMLTVSDLPNTPYSMSYYVCVDVDGIAYSILSIVPSGMVNEAYIEDGATLTVGEDSIALTLLGPFNYDLDTIVLISSSGEEIILTNDDFTYDNEYREYISNVVFENEFEFVTVKGKCAPFIENLESIDFEYPGSTYLEFELILYP